MKSVILYNSSRETTDATVRYDGKLSALLEDNTIKIGDASINFQRTLRIPDDDKTYPLPPGLGKFPIEKVQDYFDQVLSLKMTLSATSNGQEIQPVDKVSSFPNSTTEDQTGGHQDTNLSSKTGTNQGF